MWVKQFFRTFYEMPLVEKIALKACKGKVLDVGAGAGAHSVYLKEKGLDVYPIDISPGAVEVMRKQGLEKARLINFFDLKEEKYDSILMLMNGIGIVGEMASLDEFFDQCRRLLNTGADLIIDSSDIIYMFEDEFGQFELEHNQYYGEVKYTMKYKNIIGSSFNWLFVDYNNFKKAAEKNGFETELLKEQKNKAYSCLARPKF